MFNSALYLPYLEFPEYSFLIAIALVLLEGTVIVVLLLAWRRRKKAETLLSLNRDMVHQVISSVPQAVFWKDLNGVYLGCNDAFARAVGAKTPAELVGKTDYDLPWQQEDIPGYLADDREVVESQKPKRNIIEHLHQADGKSIWIETSKVPLYDLDGNVYGILGIYDDITQKKLSEEERLESEKLIKTVVTNIPVVLYSIDKNGIFTLSEGKGLAALGLKPGQVVGLSVYDVYKDVPQIIENIRRALQGEDFYTLTVVGELIYETWYSPIQEPDGNVSGLIGVAMDVTERKRAEEKVMSGLQKLEGLQKIDAAILSANSLEEIGNSVISQIQSILHANAASILTLDPKTDQLYVAASYGYPARPVFCEFFMQKTCPIWTVMETGRRFVVHCDSPEGCSCNLMQEGHFGTVCLSPIMVDQKINGIIEACFEHKVVPDLEWLDYLEGLSGQTAIAIDKVRMLNGLRVSNEELNLAYEATIEGWSKALELRDEETKGHSQRVITLSVQLAEKFGFEGEALANFRRGVLLHDIGKMAIPDSILLKPGPLNEREWEIMRKHPQYACRLLEGIAYLRPSLQIPYCHHERWNGSGYPQGLQQEEIPMEARIFAVVDVWDALTSDRPYRLHWKKEEALRYLMEARGVLFDPRVIDEFFKMISG